MEQGARCKGLSSWWLSLEQLSDPKMGMMGSDVSVLMSMSTVQNKTTPWTCTGNNVTDAGIRSPHLLLSFQVIVLHRIMLYSFVDKEVMNKHIASNLMIASLLSSHCKKQLHMEGSLFGQEYRTYQRKH